MTSEDRMEFARKMMIVAAATALTLSTAQAAPGSASLYDQLGQEPGITGVIDNFIGIVAVDARINHFFANANIGRLKTLLVLQVGMASGGPQKYTGRDMKSAHAGMGIREADFNALAEDLYMALDRSDVPFRLQQRLMAVLAAGEPAIVRQ
jgi:hemoglobin